MGRVAAIDYGMKRIGLALSTPEKTIALPFLTVEGGRLEVENVLKALENHLASIELMLIGLPLLMSGQKGEMAEKVELFAEKLKKKSNIPYLLIDERLSSKQADVHLRELSLNRKKRTQKIDCVAACLLLQSYLDSL